MKYFLISIICLTALCGCSRQETKEALPGDYKRIVTLSPSLSETVCALGLGDRIVGVTAFASYPDEVKKKAKIGGYSDINIEAVYALKPDLVLALEQQEDTTRQLQTLNLNIAYFRNDTIEETLQMIEKAGILLQVPEKAKKICNSIATEQARIRETAASLPQRRVLVSVGRNMGTGAIGDVYAAGNNTIFGEIIALAGAQNVCTGHAPYSKLGKEALLRLNPEVIIDLIPDLDTMPVTEEEVRRQWQEYQELDAVRNNRVSINTSNYICIPGPRLPLLIHELAAAIHPEYYQPAKNPENGTQTAPLPDTP